MIFYGDNINRFFFGIVVNNNDADLNLGRVQIRIAGLHGSEVQNYDLPWAQVMLPTTEPGIGGVGGNPMIGNGAQVFGVFLDGKDSQIPLVLGTVPKIQVPSQAQRSTFIGDTQPPAYTNPSPDDGLRGGVPSVPPGSLEGSTNAERVYRFFINNGFTPQQSAGITGNFAVESGLNIDPTALNPNDAGQQSFGIAQWRGPRYEDLRAYAGVANEDYRTLEVQLGFVLNEFRTTERRAATRIRSATTVADAARKVDQFYERSDGSARERRIQLAREIYQRFN
jgi:hypothetical protein